MAKRDIDFLFEMGSLRNMPRAWQQLLSGRAENVPEHVFRMALIAWTIAAAEEADVGKVLKMCMLHDLSESRTTDIAFMHRDYVTRNEELAEKHIFEQTTLEKEAHELLREYAERKTLEAKIVKDADNLEVDFELTELSKIGDTAARSMYVQHRPEVRTKKLYTKTAKKMWDELRKTDPNHWHEALTYKWVKNKKAAK
jgi:putative hydrolase of HD superfamily